MIDTVDDIEVVVAIEERLGVESLAVVIMNFEDDGIADYNEMVGALAGRAAYAYAPKKMDLDLKNRVNPPTHPSIEEPPILELKALPSHLSYAFLGGNNTLPVIISTKLVHR